MLTKYNHLTDAELVQCYRHEVPTPELVEELWLRLEARIFIQRKNTIYVCEERG